MYQADAESGELSAEFDCEVKMRQARECRMPHMCGGMPRYRQLPPHYRKDLLYTSCAEDLLCMAVSVMETHMRLPQAPPLHCLMCAHRCHPKPQLLWP